MQSANLKIGLLWMMAGVLCVWGVTASALQSATTAQPAVPVTAMTLMGTSMTCGDFERSTDFYTRGLGMTVAAGAGAGPNELVLQFPGGGPVLLCQKPLGAAVPGQRHCGPARLTILVPDITALTERLTAAGYPLAAPVRLLAQYDMAVAHVTDPNGNQLELVQRGGIKP